MSLITTSLPRWNRTTALRRRVGTAWRRGADFLLRRLRTTAWHLLDLETEIETTDFA